MKYGLIGCGRIAVNHVKAVENNELEFIAACDIEPEKVQSLLDNSGWHGGLPDIYSSYHRMLEEHPEIELVAIATESGSHAQIALDCIAAEKNLIIEKPIAMSIDDANAIIAAANDKDVKVCACHQNRFNKAVQQARHALDEGRFGEMSHGSIHVRWNRNKSYYDQAEWRGTWEQDGGTLMNQCIHGIDLLRWMMPGNIEKIYAQTRQRFHDYLEAEDVGVAVLSFDDGAVATIEGTSNVFPRNLEETLYLFGENGTVKIGGTSTNTIDVWDFADEKENDQICRGMKEATSNIYGNGHTALYADMIEAIEQNRLPYVPAEAGRDALEVVLAIYKSQKTGEVIHLPLENFASADMKNQFQN